MNRRPAVATQVPQEAMAGQACAISFPKNFSTDFTEKNIWMRVLLRRTHPVKWPPLANFTRQAHYTVKSLGLISHRLKGKSFEQDLQDNRDGIEGSLGAIRRPR